MKILLQKKINLRGNLNRLKVLGGGQDAMNHFKIA